MKIIHHIFFSRASPEGVLAFRRIGVDISGKSSLDILETDPRWRPVQQLAKEFRFVDTARTEFTSSELEGSKYLGVRPDWHHGYPEPSDDGSYLSATFDLSDYCRVCGIGKRQISPLRMKSEPRWGKRSIMQLNWIFDEYFVTPSAWRGVFSQLGVGSRPVVKNKGGHVLETVLQLDISAVSELDLTDVPFDNCSACGRKKYKYSGRGQLPEAPSASAVAFKSAQYFGSGASAYRLVYVTNEVYVTARDYGLRGANFKACRPAKVCDTRLH